MTIKCEICNKEFDKQITNSHLKTHNMTTTEYKLKYGNESLSSKEYRQELSYKTQGENNPNFGNNWSPEQKNDLSNKNKGKQAWNKGMPATDKQKENQRKTMLEKYENGYENWNKGKKLSVVTKDKIAMSIKEYASEHKDELTVRAYKAIETKKENNIDLAFFRGKNHNNTTLNLMSQKSKEYWKEKNKNKYNNYKEKIYNLGFDLLSENLNGKIKIKCHCCGSEFERNLQVFFDSKYHGYICKTCHPINIPETEISEFLKSLDIKFEQNNKSLIPPKEIDFFLPDYNLAIEYCGLYWHSELVGKNKNYHLDKYKLCQEKNIRLITIFEDEWVFNKEICKNRLKHIIGLSQKKIYARKCIIKEISITETKEFINQHHLQGYNNSKIKIGLFYNEMLVGCMTFSKMSISKGGKPTLNEWELSRFCESIRIVGGASKLLNYFVKTYKPKSIISYADKRWSNGNLYKSIGFEQLNDTPPNYWYINLQKRIHRFVLRKKSEESKEKTEWELRQEEGWNRIWDCGSMKFIMIV